MTPFSFSFLRTLKGPGTFRLLLALLVVFHHATKYIKLGEFAVYTFFMLSGYWIYKMYREKYSGLERPYLSFVVSRWLRIYPTYIFNFLLLLVFVFLFGWAPELVRAYEGGGQTQFWVSSLLLLSYNQLPDALKFLVPAWSIDIELQFYLVAPVLFFCFGRFSPAFVCLLLLGIEVLSVTVLGQALDKSFLPGIHFFTIGALLYKTGFQPSRALVILSLLAFAALVCSTYGHPLLRANMFQSHRDLLWMGINYHWLFSTLLALFLVPLVALNLNQVSTRTDRFLGNLSYDVYLFHWVLLVPYNYYFAHLPFEERMPYFLAYLCCTILGSSLIYLFVDKPVETIRAKWLKKGAVQQKGRIALTLGRSEAQVKV